MGHFIFAKLAGMSPYSVKIGVGTFLDLKLFNVRLELGILPFCGITQAYFLTLDRMKTRHLFYTIGGVFANFILLLSLIVYLNIQGEQAHPLILIPITIEFLSLSGNLVPSELKIDRQNIQSDGQQIISILCTQNYELIFHDIFETYKQQLQRYKNDREILPKTFLGNDVKTVQIFVEAQKCLYYRDFEKAAELFLEVLRAKKNVSKPEKAFILDNLVSIVAIKGYKKYLNDADRWSREAIRLASQSKTLKGTRGAILVELGRYEEGKQMLLPLTEPENEALDIAISSCYIAKAEYFLGNTEKVNEWLANAKEIDNADANQVLKRIQKEINYCV